MKNVKFYFWVAFVLFIISGYSSYSKIKAKNSYYDTCIELGYAKAQVDLALYRAHPKLYPRFSHLDPRHSGIACGSIFR